MPIEWTAIAESRRFEAVAFEIVTAAEWVGFLKSLRAANVKSYTKVFDLSHASLEMRASELRTITGVINTRADEEGGLLGAIAFIVTSPAALDLSMLYDDWTFLKAGRPMAIFATRELAIKWLNGAASSVIP